MGIKDLKDYIRKNYPRCIQNTNISEFENEKIIIDIASYLYKYKIVNGEEWLNMIIPFFCTLKKNNIHPTIIFDGKPPPEKDNEKQKRNQQQNKLESTTVNIDIDLDVYKRQSEEYKENKKEKPIPSNLLIETMNLIIKKDNNRSKMNRFLKGEDIRIDVEAIEEYIHKKDKQANKPTKDDIEVLKLMCTNFGIPYIQAPVEAEALASFMIKNNQGKAILTEDTDILAYGVNIFISGFKNSTGDCEVIYLNTLLEDMKFTQKEFLDFCILCGTDYNNRIKSVGIVNSFNIIKKYSSIDNYKEKDTSILNHIRVRDIFNNFQDIKEDSSYITKYWDTNVDFNNLYKFLTDKGCKFYPQYIEQCWKEPEIEFISDTDEGGENDEE